VKGDPTFGADARATGLRCARPFVDGALAPIRGRGADADKLTGAAQYLHRRIAVLQLTLSGWLSSGWSPQLTQGRREAKIAGLSALMQSVGQRCAVEARPAAV